MLTFHVPPKTEFSMGGFCPPKRGPVHLEFYVEDAAVHAPAVLAHQHAHAGAHGLQESGQPCKCSCMHARVQLLPRDMPPAPASQVQFLLHDRPAATLEVQTASYTATACLLLLCLPSRISRLMPS